MKLTKLQKKTAVLICFIFAAALTFCVVLRQSYSWVSRDTAGYENAQMADYTQFMDADNERSETITFEELNNDFKDADTVFVCKVLESENQYECTANRVRIEQTVCGEFAKTGEKAVLYDWSFFTLAPDKEHAFFFQGSANNLLQVGKRYLVFAQHMDYRETYQKQLPCQEFRIFGFAYVNTFCLDDNQEKPLSPYAKTYSEFADSEFICFSQKGLDNLNAIKKQMIETYVKP